MPEGMRENERGRPAVTGAVRRGGSQTGHNTRSNTPPGTEPFSEFVQCAPAVLTMPALEELVQRERALVMEIAGIVTLRDATKEQLGDAEAVQCMFEQLSCGTRCHAEKLWRGELSISTRTCDPSVLAEDLAQVSIYHWLHVVVRDLCPEAQEIVMPELYGHYLDNIHAQQDTDETSSCARWALQSLGPASVVAKQLARTHLTSREKAWSTERSVKMLFATTGWAASTLLFESVVAQWIIMISVPFFAALIYLLCTMHGSKSIRSAVLWRQAEEFVCIAGIAAATGICAWKQLAVPRLFEPWSFSFLCLLTVVCIAWMLSLPTRNRRLRSKVVRLEQTPRSTQAAHSKTAGPPSCLS